MRGRANPSAIVLAALLVAGCFEGKADVTFNPDGTGKIVGDIAFPLEPPWTGPRKTAPPVDVKTPAKTGTAVPKEAPAVAKSPEDEMKEAVTAILRRSRGIEAWKDVAFQRLSDGRVSFQGTAYFKDFSKVRIYPSNTMPFWFGQETPGSLTLILSRPQDKADSKTSSKAPPSAEEMEKKLKDERTRYHKVRPTFGLMVNGLRFVADFHVPGTPAEICGFDQARGALAWTIDGQKLLQAMDSSMNDGTALRQMILAGDALGDGSVSRMERVINKRIYGPKAELWARTTGEMQVRFDYKPEVDEAKKAFPEMMVRLGLDKPRAPPPGKKPPGEEDSSKVPEIGLPEKLPDIPVPIIPGL